MACHFPSESFVGKVILFRASADELHLAAKAAVGYDWWVEEMRAADARLILSEMGALHQARDFDECFGFHREIPHSGKVLGGAIMLSIGDGVYVNGTSQAYGKLPREPSEALLKRHFEALNRHVRVHFGSEM